MRLPFTDRELALLAKLWPSDLSDTELAHRLGRHRGVLRRKAAAIGLERSRKWARFLSANRRAA